MSFDNLTLAGVLIALPYLSLLVLSGKNWFITRRVEAITFECSENEPYRYGT